MLDWQLLLGTTSDPSIIFDRFYSSILEVIDQHIPIKQMSRKELKHKNSKRVWKGIKQIIHVKPQTDQSIIKLLDNGEKLLKMIVLLIHLTNIFVK